MQQLLAIGIVSGSHGVRGELKIRSTSGEMKHYSSLKKVTLRLKNGDTRELNVTGVRGKPDAIILAVEEIKDPETARTLRGGEILVPREAAAPLEEGEYYIGDLVTCSLMHEGNPVAEVIAVWNNGYHDMLDVSMPSGSRCTVPFQDEFIGEVDIQSRRIELKHIWILE